MTDAPLLFLATSSWNLSHFRAGLIAALRRDGHDIAAIVPEGQEPVGGGVRTYRIPLIASGTSPASESKSLLALIRTVRAIRPAAVITFTPKGNIYGGLAARVCGVPVLPNVSGLGTGFLSGGWLRRVQAALYREGLRGAPTVFFQNPDDSRLFVAEGLVTPDQVVLLPGSGVDCRHFRPAPFPPRKDAEVRLLFVGRLLGDKGLRELVEAMRRLRPRFPALRLVLAGEVGADNRSAIPSAEVRTWEDDDLASHVGKVADIRPSIAASDAVILPSYREGMPRSLLEAAAMGRPLLGSDVPGIRQLIRDGENGILFEAHSAEGIVGAVERFMTVPVATRRAWGKAARAMAERKYDEALVIEAYRKAIVAITGKAG